MSEPFIAEIRIVGFNFAPRGWAFCDGQLLPISQNTALFSLIGTTYGGDGRTTTALPNLQGRAPMHPGRGPGLTARRLGEKTGAETVTLTEAQMAAHRHNFKINDDENNEPNSQTPVNSVWATQENLNPYRSTQNNDMKNTAPEATNVAGGGGSHSNLQPFLSLNFVIALAGLYPSRS
jgi:microcystin-dependent protein